MANTGLSRFVALSSILLSAFLCGCGSSAPARFYALSPVMGNATPGKNSAVPTPFTVGVGPVEIPDFLERPNIVTRNGENGLEIAEYDRWAGSLKQDITRTLIQDLSAFLPPGVSVLFWKRSIPMDCRVTVEVTRLDVIPGRTVLLRGQWAIFGREPKVPLTMRSGAFTEHLAGTDYSTAVTGIGKAVGQMSEAIAADIEAAMAADRNKAAP
jgi:uncharacterized lipoprotein YmbA